MTDLVLRNALLPSNDVSAILVDIHVTGGVIERLVGADAAPLPREGATVVHDVDGRLVLPAMAEPHAHLDKAFLADTVSNRTGDLMGAIDAMTVAGENGRFTHDDTVQRASLALERMLINGVTAVRSHVDVGDIVGAMNVQAVAQARRSFSGLMDVQIVCLVGGPLTGPEGRGNREALRLSLEAGADVVGGCPALDRDPAGHLAVVVAAAGEAGLPIDLHIDETLDPSVLTLLELVCLVRDTGFTHKVTASHCVSLAVQALAVQKRIAAEVAAAGIAVVALPQTNLFLQGRENPVGMPRSITPINVLRDAGVLVAGGADNVQDPFNPVGRADPLETAALLAMAAHQMPDIAYGMVSNDVRSLMGLPVIGMKPGDPADLVALDSRSIRSAVADAPARRTYRAGVLVAESTWRGKVHRYPTY